MQASNDDGNKKHRSKSTGFKEFLRKQTAASAYKQALVIASTNLQQFGSPSSGRSGMQRPQSALVFSDPGMQRPQSALVFLRVR